MVAVLKEYGFDLLLWLHVLRRVECIPFLFCVSWDTVRSSEEEGDLVLFLLYPLCLAHSSCSINESFRSWTEMPLFLSSMRACRTVLFPFWVPLSSSVRWFSWFCGFFQLYGSSASASPPDPTEPLYWEGRNLSLMVAGPGGEGSGNGPSSRQFQENMTSEIWLVPDLPLVMSRISISKFLVWPLLTPAWEGCRELAGGWRWALMWQFWH